MAIGDNIDEINEKIRKLREELGKTPDSPFKPEEINKAKESLQGLETEVKNINSELDYTFSSFQSIVNEMTKGKTAINNITNATKKLSSISSQLQDQRDNINKLSAKELSKLQKISTVKFSDLRREQKFLESKGTLSTKEALYLSEISGILEENVGLEAAFNRQLESAILKQESIENSVGLTGALLKSFSSIPGLESIAKHLKIDEAVVAMEEYNEKLFNAVLNSEQVQKGLGLEQVEEDIERTTVALGDLNEKIKNFQGDKESSEFKTLLEDRKKAQKSLNAVVKKRAEIEENIAKSTTGFLGKLTTGMVGLKATIKGLGESLMDPAAIFSMIGKSMFKINAEVVQLSKNLGSSYNESQEIRKEFSAVALSSEETFYNTTRLLKAYSQYVQILGFAGKINEENSKTFASLTERVGIAAESAAKLQFFAESTGTDFREQSKTQAGIVSQVGSQFGIQLNQKQILESIGKSSAYTLAQFGGSVERLTEATAQAKALGMTLEQVNNIAGKLLNFESSITSELKAELLLGKDINLEKARLAALNNDQKTVMEEINREIGTFSDFQNLNRLQQEAYAEALGMSTDEMSDMLLMEQFRTMNAQQFAALNGEEALKRAEMLTTQQRFNDAMLKLQDVIANLVEGPLGSMAELLGSIAGNSLALGGVLGALAITQLPKLIKGFKVLRSLAISKAVADIFGGNAMLGPIGLAVAGAGVGVMLAAIASATADDMIAGNNTPIGYGKRALYDEGELTLLNDRDTVIAGTDLFKPALANDMVSGNPQIIENTTIQPTTPQIIENTTIQSTTPQIIENTTIQPINQNQNSSLEVLQLREENKQTNRLIEKLIRGNENLISATKANKTVEMDDPFGALYTT